MDRLLTGRKEILTTVRDITPDNVLDVLQKALNVHEQNRLDIDYLYDYYKGNQPVLYREKKIRGDINNKILENHADEIGLWFYPLQGRDHTGRRTNHHSQY